MKPASKLFLFPLIILLLFTTVPAVKAQTTADSTAVKTIAPDFSTAELAFCGDPAVSHDGLISPADEVDVYSLELEAGQVVTMDVDTFDNGASLDTILFVYFDSDPSDDIYPEIPIASNDRSSDPQDPLINEDPYLEITIEKNGTYYLVIYNALGDGNTGDYTLSLKCTDPSIPPEPVDPVKVGDLLGATGSDPGSFLTINPVDATSTTRFPLGVGPVVDIEFDPVSRMVFVATFAEPGSLIAIDPDTGAEGNVVGVDSGSVIALEAAGGILFGVHYYIDDTDPAFPLDRYSLVAIDQDSLQFINEVPISRAVVSLAYHTVDKVMYGVASGGTTGSELVKIDLTTGEIVVVGDPFVGVIEALDFNQDNALYVVERSGLLFNIPDLTLIEPGVKIGSIIDDTSAITTMARGLNSAAVSGLTFVIDKAPPVDPIKTICSSSLTSPMSSSSEPANNKLRRFQLEHNPLHRAIGMFKFEGKADEIIHLRAELEANEECEVEEDSAWSWLRKLLWRFKPKNRVFVCLRDAIPGVKFRVKAKGELPVEIIDVQLPADGWYYIMVIRPLRRFNQTDYCLTLESEDNDSQAWETLQVAYPGDDTEENTTSTSAEAKTEEAQSNDPVDEGSSDTEDSTPTEPAAVAPALTAVEPLSAAPASSAVEPVDEGSSQEVQPIEETTVDETEEVAPAEEPMLKGAPEIPEETDVDETEEVAPAEEPTAEATAQPTVMGAPEIPEETTIDETEEVAPAEDTEAPSMMGAPLITEETTVDETEEVTPEESADETTGDDETTDDSGSDEGESAEGNTSGEVEEGPTEEPSTS